MVVASVAAQSGCFDTIDGNAILDCVCDNSCLTCRQGEPPSPEDCYSCISGLSLEVMPDDSTGRCIATDYQEFL